MKKTISLLLIMVLLCYGIALVRDWNMLHSQMIRLHVVGATDATDDQTVKLHVKDAVNRYLNDALRDVHTTQKAKEILSEKLPQIQVIAESVLREQGKADSVTVSLCRESFPVRKYDTFTLPSGVYESLRIRIGAATGRNWWCVVFPTLCLPEEPGQLRDAAVGSGFSDELCDTITGQSGYEIRFFLLDLLGQLQNLWFQGN